MKTQGSHNVPNTPPTNLGDDSRSQTAGNTPTATNIDEARALFHQGFAEGERDIAEAGAAFLEDGELSDLELVLLQEKMHDFNTAVDAYIGVRDQISETADQIVNNIKG